VESLSVVLDLFDTFDNLFFENLLTLLHFCDLFVQRLGGLRDRCF